MFSDFASEDESLRLAVEKLCRQWEADDKEALLTYGQHLMGGAVLSCAEQMRKLLREVVNEPR